jgi:hypothetical protein
MVEYYDVNLWNNLNVVSTRIQSWIIVDEIGNLISTLFQHQKSNVAIQFAFSILLQRLSNVWEIISDVDSTLN